MLRRAFETFKTHETLIRQQYAHDVTAGIEPEGADDDGLLERPTRRFLIDGILRGLDWNPDDPTQVAEEARSWDERGGPAKDGSPPAGDLGCVVVAELKKFVTPG